MPQLPVNAQQAVTAATFTVSGAFDGAGTALALTTPTEQVEIINDRSAQWPVEFQVGGGPWRQVQENKSVLVGMDLSTTTLRFRRTINSPNIVVDLNLYAKPSGMAAGNSQQVDIFSADEQAGLKALSSRGWNARRLSASASSIALPPTVDGALWFPLSESSGTDSVDLVQGLTATASGTTTNLRANAGQATMDTNTAIVLRNNATLDSIMRLDTLVGSLIVGVQLEGGNPAANCHLWGYGDNGSNTVGGYSGVLGTSGTVTTWYGVVGGSTNVAPAFALQALLAAKGRRFHIWVIHRGLHAPASATPTIYADGYEGAWHSRSMRYRSLEPGPVGAATAQGLRIGARPTGTGGGGANHVGAQITLPRLSNFFAVRLRGDQRHLIPAYVADIARTMPVGVVPRILAGG